MFDAPLAPLVAQLAPRLRSVRAFVVLTDIGHMPQARARTFLSDIHGTLPVLINQRAVHTSVLTLHAQAGHLALRRN